MQFQFIKQQTGLETKRVCQQLGVLSIHTNFLFLSLLENVRDMERRIIRANNPTLGVEGLRK